MTVEQPEGGRDELADLRAEVERLRSAGIDWMRRCEQLAEIAREVKAERDDALARLAEAEGVARTNAAWVQQQHTAAKEAREQRDALQRKVDAVRARRDEWHAGLSETLGHVIEHWRGSDYADGFDAAMESVVESLDAALDAVEPADQPHPTPEADEFACCEHCAEDINHGLHPDSHITPCRLCALFVAVRDEAGS